MSKQKTNFSNYEISFSIKTCQSPFGHIIPISSTIFSKIFPNVSSSTINTLFNKSENDEVHFSSNPANKVDQPYFGKENCFYIDKTVFLPTVVFYKNKIIAKRNLVITAFSQPIFYFSLYRPFAKLEQHFRPTRNFYLKIYNIPAERDPLLNSEPNIVKPIIQQHGPRYIVYFPVKDFKMNMKVNIEILSSFNNSKVLIKRNVTVKKFLLPSVFIIMNQNILLQYLNKWLTVFVDSSRLSFRKTKNSRKYENEYSNSLSTLFVEKSLSSVSVAISSPSSNMISRLFFLSYLKYNPDTKFFRCYIPAKIVNHASSLFSANLFSVALYENGHRFYLKRYSIKDSLKQIFLYFRFSEDISSRILSIIQHHGFIQAGVASSPGRLPEFFPNWKIPLLSYGLVVSYHIKGNESLWIGISQKNLNLIKKLYKRTKLDFQFIPIDFLCEEKYKDQSFKSDGILLSGTLKLRKDSGGWLYSSLPKDFPIFTIKRHGTASILILYDSRSSLSLYISFSLDPEWSGHWIGLINQETSEHLSLEYNQDLIVEFSHNNRNYESSGTFIDYYGKDAIAFTERMPWFKRTFFKETVVVYPTMFSKMN